MSLFGLLAGLALLVVLTMRGMNLLVASPVCALLVALFSRLPLFPQLAQPGEDNLLEAYMTGFSGFVASWFLMFLLGAIFGKVMEDSGAAESVSRWIIEKLGGRYAALAVVLSCAILTYGGVSLFVVAFSVYPLALSLFRQADLPRRFIPATMAFGSVTFTMTSAGSPEIQNWIPIEYLNTSPYAAWRVSLVVALGMALFGYWLLQKMLRRACRRGEKFEARDTDPVVLQRRLPHPVTSLIPLGIVLFLSLLFHPLLGRSALVVALFGGVLATCALHHGYFRTFWDSVSAGATGALVAIGNTSAVVGFGAVARAVPAFDLAVDAITGLPASPLVGGAIAVSVIAALTGSASGGQAIALPVLAPHYLAVGVDPEAFHRIVALSSGALDSLPHNGYVVTTIRAICGESHAEAYPPVGALTVIVPLLGLMGALFLFALDPGGRL